MRYLVSDPLSWLMSSRIKFRFQISNFLTFPVSLCHSSLLSTQFITDYLLLQINLCMLWYEASLFVLEYRRRHRHGHDHQMRQLREIL